MRKNRRRKTWSGEESPDRWLKVTSAFIITSTLTVFGYLGYIMELRPRIEQCYGVHFLGVVDGIVLTVTLDAILILVVYILFRLLHRRA